MSKFKVGDEVVIYKNHYKNSVDDFGVVVKLPTYPNVCLDVRYNDTSYTSKVIEERMELLEIYNSPLSKTLRED